MKLIDMPDTKNEFRAQLEIFKRGQKDFLEFIAIGASIKYHAFCKYKEAGFTDEQALELCKGSVIAI